MTPATTETYLTHIESLLGEPADHSVYGSDKLKSPIRLLQFSDIPKGCTLYLTAGAASYADALGALLEAAIAIDEMGDAVGDFLVSAVLFSIRERLPISAGYSIAGIEQSAPALAKASGKSAIYFTALDKICPEMKALAIPSMAGVLGAFLITAAENDYFTEHGAEAFEAKLAETGLDLTNLKRNSAV